MGLKHIAQYKAKATAGTEVPFQSSGAPTNNVTQLGRAIVGSLLVDTTNGKAYICTATNGTSTITWVSVGSQT
jgi:hypothetical protein